MSIKNEANATSWEAWVYEAYGMFGRARRVRVSAADLEARLDELPLVVTSSRYTLDIEQHSAGYTASRG